MANYYFELDSSGVKELLAGAEMQRLLGSLADNVVGTAGEGYEKKLYVGAKRCAYTILPTSIEASKRNLKHNILVNALGAARL